MHHEKLTSIVRHLPHDYEPWGDVIRWKEADRSYPDCSHGCIHFYKLASAQREKLGYDWGICANPNSHRAGLLTFEHQGCQKAELIRRAAPVTNG